MGESIVFSRISELSETDRAVLRALTQAVYPPKQTANWPGRHLEWASPQWCVRVWGSDGQLASYAGVLLREGSHDMKPVLIGGVGGVKTHPEARRQGYAEMALRKAVDFFHKNPEVGFALLVCEKHLVPYYVRLGWQEFLGEMLVWQHGEPGIFTFNRVMTLGVGAEAPSAGKIDLRGPPW